MSTGNVGPVQELRNRRQNVQASLCAARAPTMMKKGRKYWAATSLGCEIRRYVDGVAGVAATRRYHNLTGKEITVAGPMGGTIADSDEPKISTYTPRTYTAKGLSSEK